MPRPKKTDSRQPSELELQVLNVLWEKTKGTVREVMEALPDGKQRAYTTVLSVMQLMEKKKIGKDLYQVRIRLLNDNAIPTLTYQSLKNKSHRKDILKVSGASIEVVAGGELRDAI